MVQSYDSRFGCERSRVQFPIEPFFFSLRFFYCEYSMQWFLRRYLIQSLGTRTGVIDLALTSTLTYILLVDDIVEMNYIVIFAQLRVQLRYMNTSLLREVSHKGILHVRDKNYLLIINIPLFLAHAMRIHKHLQLPSLSKRMQRYLDTSRE